MDANEQNTGSSYNEDSTLNEKEPMDRKGGASGATMTEADRAYQKAKEKVGKGVASAAGAVDGFTEKVKEHDVGRKTEEALKTAGDTTRQVAGTAAKEVKETKDHVKSQGSSTTSTSDTGY